MYNYYDSLWNKPFYFLKCILLSFYKSESYYNLFPIKNSFEVVLNRCKYIRELVSGESYFINLMLVSFQLKEFISFLVEKFYILRITSLIFIFIYYQVLPNFIFLFLGLYLRNSNKKPKLQELGSYLIGLFYLSLVSCFVKYCVLILYSNPVDRTLQIADLLKNIFLEPNTKSLMYNGKLISRDFPLGTSFDKKEEFLEALSAFSFYKRISQKQLLTFYTPFEVLCYHIIYKLNIIFRVLFKTRTYKDLLEIFFLRLESWKIFKSWSYTQIYFTELLRDSLIEKDTHISNLKSTLLKILSTSKFDPRNLPILDLKVLRDPNFKLSYLDFAYLISKTLNFKEKSRLYRYKSYINDYFEFEAFLLKDLYCLDMIKINVVSSIYKELARPRNFKLLYLLKELRLTNFLCNIEALALAIQARLINAINYYLFIDSASKLSIFYISKIISETLYLYFCNPLKVIIEYKILLDLLFYDYKYKNFEISIYSKRPTLQL